MTGAGWRRLWRDVGAASSIEYALIVALIAAAVYGSLGPLSELALALYARVTALPL